MAAPNDSWVYVLVVEQDFLYLKLDSTTKIIETGLGGRG